jgi:BirA family biotin operon repressor/biotin-[acetyl-CoA-carboxylase] ligase
MRNQQFPYKDKPIRPEGLQEGLDQTRFGSNILLYRRLSSTNTLAKELGARGAPEGTLVVAEEQMAGRGRMGRRWDSPGFVSLLFTALLRPKISLDRVFALSMVFALATLDGIEAMTGLKAMIKWPNDIYVGDKKLGGILTEFSVENRLVGYVVVGLGLNVNWSPENQEKMLYPATSIMAETGCKAPRERLLIEILKVFNRDYAEVSAGRLDEFYERWSERCVILNRPVEVESPRGVIFGKADRVEPDGTLIISYGGGKEQRILWGDVTPSA